MKKDKWSPAKHSALNSLSRFGENCMSGAIKTDEEMLERAEELLVELFQAARSDTASKAGKAMWAKIKSTSH